MLGVLTPRVHYQDGQYLLEVRQPGEWHEIREFVRPLDPAVQRLYSEVGPDPWALLDWVNRNIAYRSDNGEWWFWPMETLARHSGDCDDSALLLASLLRNFTNAHVVVGTYRDYGHAWVQIDGQALETTYTAARPVADPQNYRAYAMFNDQEVVELWPGALSEIFDLAHEETIKLNLMAEASEPGNSATALLIGVLGSVVGGIIVASLIKSGA